MADYDAKIRVSADTSAAERSLQNFETKLNGLVAGLDIGKKVGRSFTEAFVPPKQLKQLDRELATIASRADTVAKRFARVVEGVGTVGVAAKGISDVGDALQQLSVNAGQALDQVNNLAKLKQVLVPGFGAMQASISTLAKTVSTLEYKFSSLVPGAQGILDVLGSIGPQASVVSAAVATIGVAFETVLKGRAKQLETEVGTVLKTINDQTQQLLRNLEALNIPLSGTARQFQNLLRTGEERLANVSSYSDEARRALSTILTAEMRLTAELQRQAVLRREMEASRFASVAQRTGMQFTFGGPKALPMAGQTAFQGAMRGGLGGGARSLVPSQTEMLVNAAGGRASRSGIEARATTASLQFGTTLSTEVDKLNALSAAEKARTKEINARLLPAFNEQRVREGTVKILNNEVKLNESNLRIEQALNGERARGVRFLEKQTAEEQRQVQLGILGQKTNRLPGQIGGPGFPSAGPVPLGMYGQGRTPAGGRRGGGFGRAASGALSNAAVGGAFPLLFGQSGSAAAGGAIGGIAGSLIPGIGGFGGSLIGTILGEKLGQGDQIKKLSEDIGFSAEQTKLLGTAFQQAGREFDKFQLSVQNIRGLSLTLDDQADAINLVSTLTKNYGGQIDKVTNAFTSALESGKVTQATLNQLTSQGIPIQQALADKYKVSRDTILAMAKDGKISVQGLTNTLIDMGNKGVEAVNKPVTGFDKFMKGVDGLMASIGSLAGAIVTKLTPAFNWLMARLGEIIGLAAQGIQAIANMLSGGDANTTKAYALARKRLAAEGGPSVGTRNLTVEQKATVDKYRSQELAKLTKPANTKIGAIQTPGQAPPSGGGAGSNKAANDAQRLAEQTKKQLDDAFKLNELASARLDLQVSLAGEESLEAEFNKVALERRIKFVDLQKEAKSQKERELLVSAQLSTILADNNQYEKDKQKLFAQQTAELYTQIGLSEVLGKKFQGTLAGGFMGTSGTGTFRTDLNLMPGLTGGKLGEEFATIEQQLRNLLDPATQVITAAEGISNAFGTAFKGLVDGTMTAQEALAGFFQSVASNFADMAAQMIAKYIQMQIIGLAQKFLPVTGGIFGAGGATNYSGAFGGGGGLGSSQFGTGGEYIFGGFRAGGGPVSAGTPYMVGEKGPELFMPGRSGTVIPNNALGGGSTSVVVNVDASGNSNVQGDQAQAKQLGVVVSAAVQAELVKQQRPGGLLAGTRR
jgi:tape measure domain-containing protein